MADEPSKEALEASRQIISIIDSCAGDVFLLAPHIAVILTDFAAAAVERERERAVLDYDAVLGERDKFIVGRGLFMDFVAQLPKDAPRRSMFVEARNAALEEAAKYCEIFEAKHAGAFFAKDIRALKTETPN